jgi:Uma2 family endonuclease
VATTHLDPSQWVDDPDYPDDDGKPMSDNSLQYDWISIIKWGLEFQFLQNPEVVVAGNMLWYPRRKLPGETAHAPRQAPDAMVIFGRPKGYRGSYKQWQENDVPVHVVFEVCSPNNTDEEMEEKLQFYDEFGAEEYYLVYPEFPAFVEGWHRTDGRLVSIPKINDWVSPRLGIRFEVARGRMHVFHPDGSKFMTPTAMAQRGDEEHERAELERSRAEVERLRAERALVQVEVERLRAEQVAAAAELERVRKEKLAAKLRELGLDPDTI